MHWRLTAVDTQAAQRLSQELNLLPLVAEIMIRRGINDPEQAQAFLNPSLGDLPDPRLLPDLEPAVARLLRALENNERVTVYGDYDADGLTATALLADFLGRLGFDVDTYIPHRIEEGYGLNPAAVERLAGAGTHLIVTVDCGVSDVEPVVRAGELGVDVIVTDHHQVPSCLPPALAVINPHRRESRFPQKPLAGVGVAFFLAGGLRQALRQNGNCSAELASSLGLVAIGTVADVSPLTRVNRILVRHGLLYLADPAQPGLAALKSLGAMAPGRPVTSQEVAFRLAPRLNAAGRLGSADPGLRVLMTREPDDARALADELETLNKERRRLQGVIQQEAERLLELEGDTDRRTIVLAREGWSRGIVGLAASKLAEKYGKPALLLAVTDGMARGSGRSVPGFNLFAALDQCRELMERFGGHEQAAGVTLAADRTQELAAAFEAVAARDWTGPVEPVLTMDALVRLDDLPGLHPHLNRMAPFGEANPEPVLAVSGVTVLTAGVTNGNHLKLTVTDGGASVELIGFGLGGLLPELGRTVSLALTPHISTFRGQTREGWRMVDVRRGPLN